MAATTAIAVAVGSTAYNAIESNQQRQKAKGQASKILASAPPTNPATADTAALTAQAKQRQKAMSTAGRNATILTGPHGVAPSAPPATSTLLGL